MTLTDFYGVGLGVPIVVILQAIKLTPLGRFSDYFALVALVLGVAGNILIASQTGANYVEAGFIGLIAGGSAVTLYEVGKPAFAAATNAVASAARSVVGRN